MIETALSPGYWVHDLDPVVLPIYKNLAIRWYGLSYVAGFLIAGWLLSLYFRKKRSPFDPDQQISFILTLAIGTLVGGRLGYMLLYDLSGLVRNPLTVIRVWEGGMASHGGFLGCIMAVYLISRKSGTPFFRTGDIAVTLAPPGILFGRVANFINGELWGKTTEVPWAVIFPQSAPPGTPWEQIPARHPSQLYEASLEGLVLGAYIQWRFWSRRGNNPPSGQITGEFFIAYALLRIISEIFREPDEAGLLMGLSRGTFYSLVLGLIGVCWIFAARRR